MLGLKLQGTTQVNQTSITSDAWLGWRHSYTTNPAKIYTKFADASPRFFTESDRVHKDSFEGSFRVSFEQLTGYYGGIEAWGSKSNDDRGIGINLFLGKRF